MYCKEFTERDQIALEDQWQRDADDAYEFERIEAFGYTLEDIQFMADITFGQGEMPDMIEFVGAKYAVLAKLVAGEEMRVFPRNGIPVEDYISVKPFRKPIKLYEIEGVFNTPQALLTYLDI
jgi:hypothetical protein